MKAKLASDYVRLHGKGSVPRKNTWTMESKGKIPILTLPSASYVIFRELLIL